MSLRILIVDDSSMIRHLVRQRFEAEPGWQISEAGNGLEAIEMAKQSHPDLIVLDLSMPVMNGLEVAQILHKLMPCIPIIMFTSFITHNLEQEAVAAGVRRVMVKGGPLTELVRCIYSLAEKQHAERENAA